MHIIRPSVPLTLVVGLLTALTGCGEEVTIAPTATSSYDGPLRLEPGEGAHPRAGAAGDVVQCDTWGHGGFESAEVYAEGATSDSASEALETAFSEGLSGFLPRDLAVAADTDDRVLYVAEVGGVPKAAVIVHDGQATEGAGGDGWYAESWATCDPAELPAGFVEEAGLEVWTTTDGAVVPTTELSAFRGAEHCDWQAMTFLRLGKGRDAPTYVREPDQWFEENLAVEPYDDHTSLPTEAVDSGYRRAGDTLWLVRDGSRVYVGDTPDDVESWPRLRESPGCM